MAENQTINLKKPLDNLIFDRVTKDIVEGNKKGYYNFNDLNRIETWCRYLSDYLNKYNYRNHITPRTNWVMSDLPYNSELERIRKNIKTLKDTYITVSEMPDNLNLMTIDKANIIEKILDEIDYILSGMENNFVYCGIADCGRTGIWQQRFRKSKTWISQPYKLSQYSNTDTLSMIATNNRKGIKSSTSKIELTLIDKRNDIFASIESVNNNMKKIDALVGFECEYYTLRNIIEDSSFENNKWDGAIYSSNEKLFNTRSLYFPAGATTVATINTERPIVNHHYYGRRYMKTNGKNEPDDRRFELWGGDGVNLNWVFAYNEGNYPDWQFDSSIHVINGVDYPQEKQTIIRCFNVNTSADTWIDGVMIVDLTETFGTGNEPTQNWCDINIPYFEKTTTIKIRKENN